MLHSSVLVMRPWSWMMGHLRVPLAKQPTEALRMDGTQSQVLCCKQL